MLKSKDVCLVKDTSSTQTAVHIINLGDGAAAVFSGTPLGTCESFYDATSTKSVHFAYFSTELQDQLSPKQLPSHLYDLLERSAVHLSGKEADILTDLLIRYKHIFAQSPDDLGRTDSTE